MQYMVLSLASKCLTFKIVYHAVVSAKGMNDKKYIDMTQYEFKIRFRNQKMSLNSKNYKFKMHSFV